MARVSSHRTEATQSLISCSEQMINTIFSGMRTMCDRPAVTSSTTTSLASTSSPASAAGMENMIWPTIF